MDQHNPQHTENDPLTPRRRGRPRTRPVEDGSLSASVEDAPADEVEDGAEAAATEQLEAELAIREKAVKLGLMGAEAAGMLPLAEIEQMIADAEMQGIGVPGATEARHHLVGKDIIRGLLDMLLVMSANGMPIQNMCVKCEHWPATRRQECICHDARRYLELP